ncbi:MAG: Dabb family protein [Verrucomicrobia subdivision 3 bacterium]|nr:Dabb family protein [Limisphaerales bacterium]
MKTIALLIAITLSACLTLPAAEGKEKDKDAKSAGKGKLLHVVSFKFKDTATKEQIKQVEDAFRGLKKKITEIKDYQWGTNVSPEKHDKGFTHGFILTFNSDKDRDAYLVHPDHKEFGKLVGPVLADVFVIDFWTQD